MASLVVTRKPEGTHILLPSGVTKHNCRVFFNFDDSFYPKPFHVSWNENEKSIVLDPGLGRVIAAGIKYRPDGISVVYIDMRTN